jgi:hypothetical protein
MSRSGTWILAFIALALLGWILLGPEEWRSSRLGAEDYVLRVESRDIRALELIRDGETLRFERLPDGWEMGPAPKDRAQTAVVERVLEATQLLRILDRIDPGEFSSEDEQNYGFASPRHVLRLETPRGTETLIFGREGVGEDRVFVRRGESRRTYLVGDELHRLLLQPIEQFRDPRLIPLPVDRIERVRVNRPEGAMEFVHQGGRWRLVRPLQARVENELFEKALENVLGARIFSFLSNEPPAEGGELLGVIEIWPEGEDRPLRLHVTQRGAANQTPGEGGEARLAVWHENRQTTVEVAADNFQLLQLPPDSLRSRLLTEIDPDLVDRITIQRGDEAIRLLRDDEEGWQLQGGSPVDVPAAWVGQLFDLVNKSRVEEFLLAGSPGLPPAAETPPAAQIFFDSWLSENTPESLAGRHPLRQLQLWPMLDGTEDSTLPPGVVARLDEEAGGRYLRPSFWNQFEKWWESAPYEKNGK